MFLLFYFSGNLREKKNMFSLMDGSNFFIVFLPVRDSLENSFVHLTKSCNSSTLPHMNTKLEHRCVATWPHHCLFRIWVFLSSNVSWYSPHSLLYGLFFPQLLVCTFALFCLWTSVLFFTSMPPWSPFSKDCFFHK